MSDWIIRLVETPEELQQAEQLQRIVWPGSDTDVIPSHLLITAAHNGGLVLGAFLGDRLVGLLFGFAGLSRVGSGWRPKHCSHQMGIHPDFRNRGIGYALKCAQAQIVREQGLDLITWTYDPLLSANAHLNIARLGAICNTYLRDAYGPMRDGLNVWDLPSLWMVNVPYGLAVDPLHGQHSSGPRISTFDQNREISASVSCGIGLYCV